MAQNVLTDFSSKFKTKMGASVEEFKDNLKDRVEK